MKGKARAERSFPYSKLSPLSPADLLMSVSSTLCNRASSSALNNDYLWAMSSLLFEEKWLLLPPEYRRGGGASPPEGEGVSPIGSA